MALNYGYRVTRTRLLDSKLLEELKKRTYVIEIRMEIIFRILCIADVSRVIFASIDASTIARSLPIERIKTLNDAKIGRRIKMKQIYDSQDETRATRVVAKVGRRRFRIPGREASCVSRSQSEATGFGGLWTATRSKKFKSS